MSKAEKIAVGSVLASLILSFTLFGVWEDKIWLYAPVLTLIYLSSAIWLVAATLRRSRGSSVAADVGRGFPVVEGHDLGFSVAAHGGRGFPVVEGHDFGLSVAAHGGRGQVSDTKSPASGLRFRVSGFTVPPGGVCLLLFWLYSLVLIPFSVLPYEAKISSLGFGGYLAIYWASSNLLSRFSFRKTVWTVVFSALVLVALYSLVQHKINPEILFGRLRYTNYGERLGGTYICPNHIAHLFQMWLPLCIVFLFIPQFGWFWRICFAYALPLFLLLIYQTQSRAGILGTVAAIGATVLLLILRKSSRAFCVALIVVPLLGAVTLGVLWTGSSMFRDRMTPVVKVLTMVSAGDWERAAAIDFRPQIWLDTVTMIKDRPLFGVGPGNYGLTFEDYRKRCQAVRVETVHPHNEYLELLAEYGMVGCVLVLCVLLSISWQMIRFIRNSPRPYHALPAIALLGALAGTAVHGFFDFELRIFPNAMMLALLAGCAAAPLMQSKVGQASSLSKVYRAFASPLSPSKVGWASSLSKVYRALAAALSPSKVGRASSLSRTRGAVQWMFAFAVLLLSLWTIQTMSSSWIRVWGDKFFSEQKFQRAESFYKTAERIDPQNWQAQLGLGQTYYHYRYYELNPIRKREWALKEQSAYASAYRTNTKIEDVAYGLGCVELFLGNRDKGLDYLRQAAKYKRFNDFYWRKLGIELRKAGLYDEALSAFEYAQKLDRSNPTVNRNIEWIKVKTGVTGGRK